MRQRGDFGDIGVVNTMSRINNEAEIMPQFGTLTEYIEFSITACVIVGVTVSTGVEFDPRTAQLCRHFDLCRVGINEETRHDACLAHRGDDFAHAGLLADYIEAAFRRDLFTALRD